MPESSGYCLLFTTNSPESNKTSHPPIRPLRLTLLLLNGPAYVPGYANPVRGLDVKKRKSEESFVFCSRQPPRSQTKQCHSASGHPFQSRTRGASMGQPMFQTYITDWAQIALRSGGYCLLFPTTSTKPNKTMPAKAKLGKAAALPVGLPPGKERVLVTNSAAR
ncbi:hypothetical protein CEXT_334001 [Caerostris extrusa]|uniref:Uncharacterized protein n=1 Tax=Caerostris extrusa TaxID=172846 RepID=A0AAV4XXF5_CAEEX|nr:hypothetical protein CEXT_334001 [Caerostris extrusa]